MHSQPNNEKQQNVNEEMFTIGLRSAFSLDTKETLRQFSFGMSQNVGTKEVKKAHGLSKQRLQNLTIADILETSTFKENPEIKKTISYLRWCSKDILLRSDFTDTIDVFGKSKNCKNPNCGICRRARSAKIAARVESAMTDPKNEGIFGEGEIYFLTLTVKTDEVTRTHNYLKEFKDYLKKFYRTKWFKKNVKGGLTSVENVITNKYHIHSHSLILCNDLEDYKADEQEIKKEWNKITGDSFIVKLLPVVNDIRGAIMEVVKYSTKSPNIKGKYKDFPDLLAKWIIETKGQNFINALGVFRGLELTGNKSKYDEKFPAKFFTEQDIGVLTKTKKLNFNWSAAAHIPKVKKQAFSETVKITHLDNGSFIAEGFECYDLFEEMRTTKEK
jgi:hypothetical protein